MPKVTGKEYTGDVVPWLELVQRLEDARNTSVRVGVLASKGGSEPHSEGSPITMIEIAAIHEFGSPAANIPERSFIRLTLEAMNDELQEILRKVAKGVVLGKFDVETALNIVGSWATTQIRNAIAGSGAYIPLWEELKPATIERKGSDRPLIDTGRLMQAIQWEIVRA
jgi:hypothetical protein